jgi:integrase
MQVIAFLITYFSDDLRNTYMLQVFLRYFASYIRVHSTWLFPSTQHPDRHITEKQFYKIMSKTGDLLGINYLGTHTMRKTGAYRVYTQSNYNIGLVMNLLNHSSEAMTLTYLGLDQASTETMLDQIDFG